jgi:acyl-CoA thioesterase-1
MIRKHLTRQFTKLALLVLTTILMVVPGQAQSYTILVWGDSLSSAYRIPVDQGWVALLGERVSDRNIKVVNGSIPGEVTYGGVERLSQALASHGPDLVVIALGSNDGLQGLDIGQMRNNLMTMIETARHSDADVLLLGMMIPPNYGKQYANNFHNVYLELAETYKIELVPFFLEPVALDFDLMQADGYHPVAGAQLLLLDHVWPVLNAMIPE